MPSPNTTKRPPSVKDVQVAVAIVNWRSAPLTIDCLHSLAPLIDNGLNAVVYVVDNDSKDNSVQLLRNSINQNSWSSWIHLICSETNGGFAAGNNLAISNWTDDGYRPSFVLLLNPDTILREHAIDEMLSFMESHPEIGILGGRSEDLDTTPQQCCFRFPTAIGEFSSYLGIGTIEKLLEKRIPRMGIPEEPTEVDWVSGAFMMIRPEVIDNIGLMDESYFLYFEETDFTLRAKRYGWKVWHLPAARIVHFVGQSSGINERKDISRLPRYWFESRTRFYVINSGRAYAALTDMLVIIALGIRRLRQVIQPTKAQAIPYFFTDLLDASILKKPWRSIATRKIPKL